MPDNLPNLQIHISSQLLQALLQMSAENTVPLYLVGGTVRDWLLGRSASDIDIAAHCSATVLAKQLRAALGGGALVDLSGPDDEAVRVVWRKEQVDFATFRAGTTSIEEDLRLRDFTLNAMAVPLAALATGGKPLHFIDPIGGLTDLRNGRIVHCPGAFINDPLRMLRGYRLSAMLRFHLADETRVEVKMHAGRIALAAAERIGYELRLIFQTPETARVLQAMDEDGLLALLLPELCRGKSVVQPEFHHLDVFGHSLLALGSMDEILADPERFFPSRMAEITRYLQQENTLVCMKWAALLHDIGKPVTRAVQADKDDRVTFYRHDEEGVAIFREFAERSRWSNADIERTGGLIGMHMHPFHLCNVARAGKITRRAALKLCQRAGSDLPGLFLLAMADSMASRGEKKPERMEAELRELFDSVQKIYDEHIQPVLFGPRLLTGKDLIGEFGLQPGPVFTTLLEALEVARVEGEVTDRRSALAFVAAFLHSLAVNHPTSP